MKTYDERFQIVLKLSWIRIAIVVVFVVVYFCFSVWQWRSIVVREEEQLQRIVSVLNNELEYVERDSSNILSNPYVIQLLSEKQSVNMADNLEFFNMLDLFFQNYANNTTGDRPAIIIYHDNEKLFENRYLKSTDRLDDEVLLQLEQLQRGGGLWKQEQEELYYYCSFKQKSVNAYLEYHVDNAILERYIRNAEELQGSNYIIYETEKLSENREYKILTEELISETKIKVAIPYVRLRDIFIHNLYLIASIVIAIMFLLRYYAKKTFHNISTNIYAFADAIMNINAMGEGDYLNCDIKDEMYPIYSKINELISSINAFRQEREQAEKEKLELKINLLQSRLNPHLLFNSLSVIRWKLMKVAPEQANDVSVLSRYFRDALNGEKYDITLGEEIKLEKEFVAVMEVLNNREYDFTVDVDETLLTEKTMKLILQPFIENAILHGLQLVEKPVIYIAAVRTDVGYQIRVEDNGCGMPKKKVDALNEKAWEEIRDGKRESYGIRNSYERMNLFYANRCIGRIESMQGKGTKVILDIKQ